MFGHKSFLKIGPLNDSSIQGLYKDSYELDHCYYGFSQGCDRNGKAQTEVRGGSISVTIPGIPASEIIEWSVNSREYKDGVIVICDDNDMPLEKVHFNDAACIAMEIVYSQKGKGYIATKLVVHARKITVGDTELDNRWSSFDS